MSTAVAKADSNLKTYLVAKRATIMEACAHGVDPDRLIKTMCLLVTSKNGEAIAGCSQESILRAVVDCARFGIDPAFGRAYIVPYAGQAELQLGYLGLIELAKRSGEIKSITAELVQEGDDFEIEFGTNPKFSHRPKFQGDGNGYKRVYALAVFNDGHFEYTVLSKDDVEHIKTTSAKKTKFGEYSPAWKNYPGEMAKKCAIRRLCKTLPLTIEAQEAIAADDQRNNVIDVDSQPAMSGRSTAATKLDRALGIDKPKEPETLDVEPEGNGKTLGIPSVHNNGDEPLEH